MMRSLKIFSIFIVVAVSAAGSCSAQDTTQVSEDLQKVIEAHGDSIVAVVVMGRELFQVPAVSVVSARDRANALGERILQIARVTCPTI